MIRTGSCLRSGPAGQHCLMYSVVSCSPPLSYLDSGVELLAPEVCETLLPLKRGVGETVSPPACGQDVALSTMALQLLGG